MSGILSSRSISDDPYIRLEHLLLSLDYVPLGVQPSSVSDEVVQSVLNSRLNPPPDRPILRIVAFFLSTPHPGEYCLAFLNKVLCDVGIAEVDHVVRDLYRIPSINPRTWFSPATDFLVAKMITKYTIAAFVEDCPWNPQAPVFIRMLLHFACGGPFLTANWEAHPGTTRCRAVFRQCIRGMNDDTSRYCFWLFTQADREVELLCPLAEEFRSHVWDSDDDD